MRSSTKTTILGTESGVTEFLRNYREQNYSEHEHALIVGIDSKWAFLFVVCEVGVSFVCGANFGTVQSPAYSKLDGVAEGMIPRSIFTKLHKQCADREVTYTDKLQEQQLKQIIHTLARNEPRTKAVTG